MTKLAHAKCEDKRFKRPQKCRRRRKLPPAFATLQLEQGAVVDTVSHLFWSSSSGIDVMPESAGMVSVSTLSTPAEWEHFLKMFADALGVDEWPGAPGAAEQHLEATETRLKIKLPPSYRAFLSASNGWRNASRAVPVLRPAGKIRWFKREHKDWVQAYLDPMRGVESLLPAETEYFEYSKGDCVNFDIKHLAHTLCVSEVGDSAVLLLNPMVVWPDGEWETWFFANWLPGAARYRSFADWMRHELAELQDAPFAHSNGPPGELPTVYVDGPTKDERRVRPREEILTYDEALKRLGSKTRARRIKAVRQLCRIGGAAAITTVLDLLANDYDFHVRCEAAEMLGRMRAEAAIDLLIKVTGETSYVTSTAVEALGNFHDEVSAKRLLDMVEEDGPSAGVAAYALAKRNDPRGILPLVKKLVSKEPADQSTGNIAGRSIARFEKPGYLALEQLVEHEDLEVRHRATTGIFDIACISKDKELKVQARNLLERRSGLESDEALRQSMAVYLAVACNKKPPGTDNPFSGS